MDDKKLEKNVSCYRRCKRSVRKCINWNEWSLKYQLRMHLVLMLCTFFVLYYAILVSMTYVYYRITFSMVVRPDLESILDQRLENFSKSTATSLYHLDEIGIL